MAFRSLCLLAPLFMLLSSGKSTEGACTVTELEHVQVCISVHGYVILDALQNSPCNHSLITLPVCRSFKEIVECITSHSSINQTTCVPNAPAEINPYLSDYINCTVEDFFQVCTDVHNPWGFGISNTTITPNNTGQTAPDSNTITSSTTITTGGDDGTGGCERKSVTQYLWVTSLMTTFLAMTINSADEF